MNLYIFGMFLSVNGRAVDIECGLIESLEYLVE